MADTTPGAIESLDLTETEARVLGMDDGHLNDMTRYMMKVARHAQAYGAGAMTFQGAVTGRYTATQVAVQRQHAAAQMNKYFADRQDRMRDRTMAIDTFKQLLDSIPKSDSLLRGIFTAWWARYRVENRIYDPEEQPRIVAEIRIGLAKSVEAAAKRRELRAMRAEMRRIRRETHGR